MRPSALPLAPGPLAAMPGEAARHRARPSLGNAVVVGACSALRLAAVGVSGRPALAQLGARSGLPRAVVGVPRRSALTLPVLSPCLGDAISDGISHRAAKPSKHDGENPADQTSDQNAPNPNILHSFVDDGSGRSGSAAGGAGGTPWYRFGATNGGGGGARPCRGGAAMWRAYRGMMCALCREQGEGEDEAEQQN